jgi:hypothetical protein
MDLPTLDEEDDPWRTLGIQEPSGAAKRADEDPPYDRTAGS